ncbi:hypothetical protein BCU43_003635 [Vibrio lentus]
MEKKKKKIITKHEEINDQPSRFNSYPQNYKYTFPLENEDIVKSLKKSGEFKYYSINKNKYSC